MKKRMIAALLCLCFCLSFGLTACQSGGNTPSQPSNLQGDWVENSFTNRIPKPLEGKVTSTETTDSKCTIGLEMEFDDFLVFVDQLKDSDFTKNKQEEDHTAQKLYVYIASNKDGVRVSTGFVGGIVAIEITEE